MDTAWIGLIGAVAGGIVGSLTSLLSPLVLWRTEQKRLNLEHKHELDLRNEARATADIERKRALVAQWRLETSKLVDAYNEMIERTPSNHREPIALPVYEPWYQLLKPHVDEMGTTAMLASTSEFTDWIGTQMLREIAEVEAKWELY